MFHGLREQLVHSLPRSVDNFVDMLWFLKPSVETAGNNFNSGTS